MHISSAEIGDAANAISLSTIFILFLEILTSTTEFGCFSRRRNPAGGGIKPAQKSSQHRNHASTGIKPAQESCKHRNQASTGIMPAQESSQHRNQSSIGIQPAQESDPIQDVYNTNFSAAAV